MDEHQAQWAAVQPCRVWLAAMGLASIAVATELLALVCAGADAKINWFWVYITFRFVLLPLLSLALIVRIAISLARTMALKGRLLLAPAAIVPFLNLLVLWAHPQLLLARRVPEDHSLSVAEYIERGLPDPESDLGWTLRQKDAARVLLNELWMTDNRLLPRAESTRSGRVFRRILDEEFQMMHACSSPSCTADNSMMTVYSPRSNPGEIFDREWVEFVARALNDALEAMEAVRRFCDQERPAASNPKLEEARASTCDARRNRMLVLFAFAPLAQLCENRMVEPQSRRAGLKHLEAASRRATELVDREATAQIGAMVERVRAAAD